MAKRGRKEVVRLKRVNLNVEPPDRGNLMPSDEDVMAHVLGVVIVQTFSLKRGKEVWGQGEIGCTVRITADARHGGLHAHGP